MLYYDNNNKYEEVFPLHLDLVLTTHTDQLGIEHFRNFSSVIYAVVLNKNKDLKKKCLFYDYLLPQRIMNPSFSIPAKLKVKNLFLYIKTN